MNFALVSIFCCLRLYLTITGFSLFIKVYEHKPTKKNERKYIVSGSVFLLFYLLQDLDQILCYLLAGVI